MLRHRVHLVATLAFATLAAGAAQAQYHVVKKLDLGVARADYIVIDPIGRRLYGLADKVIDVDHDTCRHGRRRRRWLRDRRRSEPRSCAQRRRSSI